MVQPWSWLGPIGTYGPRRSHSAYTTICVYGSMIGNANAVWILSPVPPWGSLLPAKLWGYRFKRDSHSLLTGATHGAHSSRVPMGDGAGAPPVHLRRSKLKRLDAFGFSSTCNRLHATHGISRPLPARWPRSCKDSRSRLSLNFLCIEIINDFCVWLGNGG